MSMTDPVSDMLTRIRNAAKARFKDVLMPNSSLKHAIAKILKEEGYIKDISIVKDKGRSSIKIMLKYTPSKKNAITKRQYLKRLKFFLSWRAREEARQSSRRRTLPQIFRHETQEPRDPD